MKLSMFFFFQRFYVVALRVQRQQERESRDSDDVTTLHGVTSSTRQALTHCSRRTAPQRVAPHRTAPCRAVPHCQSALNAQQAARPAGHSNVECGSRHPRSGGPNRGLWRARWRRRWRRAHWRGNHPGLRRRMWRHKPGYSGRRTWTRLWRGLWRIIWASLWRRLWSSAADWGTCE